MYGISAWMRSVSYGSVMTLLSLSAAAQDDAKLLRERTADQRPALLVLGSGHLDNPGRDVVNIKVDDVLAPARQAEIRDVVEQLASFQPTHIAVEWPSKEQAALDTRYRDYREGRYPLGRAEDEQIGLRLAAKLKLARVHAVDWNEAPTGDYKYYDWVSHAKTHGDKAWVSALFDPKRSTGIVPLGTHTIGSWLLQMNRPGILAANHRNYFDLAGIGDADQQPGANWVGYWYGRNLRIFNNLVRLTDRPQDRILAIYGMGHAYLLRQFSTESGAFRLVEVDSVLKEK